MTTLLHLVYVHGFQGDDTSFQSFPLHLQERISSENPNFRVQSGLYPTYKSVKPLSHATQAFLQWLSTQPDGPVILLGHSMGGLLAAEAAVDASNSLSMHGRPRRIAGVVAFDTPFLGMHPHVIVSGIASLLPNKTEDRKSTKPKKELNQHPQVHVVEQSVTDDWEDFKKKIQRKTRPRSQQLDRTSSYLDIPSGGSSSASSISSNSRRSRSPSPFMERALDFVASRTDPDDPIARWLRKHADDPLSASKRWVVERFQFGSCMFDPAGLRERYLQLLQWKGLWINYWTETPARDGGNSREQNRQEWLANDAALVSAGICPSPGGGEGHHGGALALDEEVKTPHHFVVLPRGLGQRLGGMEHWEKVVIAGVDDEVEGHTGLFIPSSNLDYDRFVDRVADKILDWGRSIL